MAHEDFAHLTGDGSVAREIWGQEHSIKAETFRSNSRHRRTDSKLSCFIGSGADNGATTPPSDDDRLAAQLSARSEEHTSELQSLRHLVCRLLLEKKKQ